VVRTRKKCWLLAATAIFSIFVALALIRHIFFYSLLKLGLPVSLRLLTLVLLLLVRLLLILIGHPMISVLLSLE
jgi:hypothetical protein